MSDIDLEATIARAIRQFTAQPATGDSAAKVVETTITRAEMDAVLERLDALDLAAEINQEGERLAREVTRYVADKRSELSELRLYRKATLLVAAVLTGFVGGGLLAEMLTGFTAFRTISFDAGTGNALAAYVGGSILFVLAVLLVTLRGVFGAIEQAEKDGYLPPHLKELQEVVKKIA